MELYIHEPDDISKYTIYAPSTKEVPDVKITKEKWICEPVKVKCTGKIKVIGDKGNDGIQYSYGDNKSAELYEWDYVYIDESTISNMNYSALDKALAYLSVNESKDASELDSDFKKKSDLHFKILDMKSSSANKYIPKEWKDEFNYKAKDAAIAVCKEDDKLAGFIYWNPKSGAIGPLKVYSEYRGYGISELLLKTAIDGGGYKLGVYEDNNVAYNLYKKMGFKEVDRKEYADGDVAIMMELNKK
jgi:ribosomal protein S18 acetylase RimI-like enzyme